VKYLPSSTMVYSCTCARLQNPEAPPIVCVPRSGSAAPVRIPQTAAHTNTAPSEQSPKIVNTVTDYPATVHRHYRYRGACVWGAWARNVSIDRGTVDWFQKRGEGYVHRVRITDPTSQAGVVHARDTWQHTTPLHGNSPSPPTTKNQASGRACSNEPPARDHADAPRSTEAGSRFWSTSRPTTSR
jgi:hypothetical protein